MYKQNLLLQFLLDFFPPWNWVGDGREHSTYSFSFLLPCFLSLGGKEGPFLFVGWNYHLPSSGSLWHTGGRRRDMWASLFLRTRLWGWVWELLPGPRADQPPGGSAVSLIGSSKEAALGDSEQVKRMRWTSLRCFRAKHLFSVSCVGHR